MLVFLYSLMKFAHHKGMDVDFLSKNEVSSMKFSGLHKLITSLFI